MDNRDVNRLNNPLHAATIGHGNQRKPEDYGTNKKGGRCYRPAPHPCQLVIAEQITQELAERHQHPAYHPCYSQPGAKDEYLIRGLQQKEYRKGAAERR